MFSSFSENPKVKKKNEKDPPTVYYYLAHMLIFTKC